MCGGVLAPEEEQQRLPRPGFQPDVTRKPVENWVYQYQNSERLDGALGRTCTVSPLSPDEQVQDFAAMYISTASFYLEIWST